MEESNRKSQLAELIENDENGPSTRAHKVLQLLRNSTVTDWDMVCFAVEFLAMMHTVYPWLEESAREITRLVYIAHYNEIYSDNRSFSSSQDTNEGEAEASKKST